MNRRQRRARRAQQHRRFPQIGIGATVGYIGRKTDDRAQYMTVEAACPRCSCFAIVKLPDALRDAKSVEDGTTHVCLPAIGGCNTGFRFEGAPELAQTGEEENAK